MEKQRIINYINKHRPRISKTRLQALSLHSLVMIEAQVTIEKLRDEKIRLN